MISLQCAIIFKVFKINLNISCVCFPVYMSIYCLFVSCPWRLKEGVSCSGIVMAVSHDVGAGNGTLIIWKHSQDSRLSHLFCPKRYHFEHYSSICSVSFLSRYFSGSGCYYTQLLSRLIIAYCWNLSSFHLGRPCIDPWRAVFVLRQGLL